MEDNRKVFKVKRLITETKEYNFYILARDKDTVEKELQKALDNEFNQTEYVNNPLGGSPCGMSFGSDVGKLVSRSLTTEVSE